MLLQLNISNFALIENLSISFEEGFNVFSGETGAGKSILIDAISYVLGGKFSRDFIRTGENKTYVETIFTIENDKIKKVLDEEEIEYEDIVIISRETFQSGKSIIKVNGKSMLVSSLRKITSTLIDIHGQHENQNLLDPVKHITYLDEYSSKDIEDLLSKYKNKFDELKQIESKICELSGKNGDREREIDFLKFQIDEIESAKLDLNEEEELEKKFLILSNAEKIGSVLSNCYSMLYEGTEGTSSIYDTIGQVFRELKGIEKHIESIKPIASSLEEIYYNLEEYISEIRNIKDSVYYDENELEFINNRMYLIGNLKKKYGNTIKDIIQYYSKIEKQYDELINMSEVIDKLNNEEAKLKKELNDYSEDIHEIRVLYSKKLEKMIVNELSYIGMNNSTFSISIDKTEEFTPIGKDKVQFLISTNPGEPLKPLEKVVSGGELSRVMLALKTVFVDKDEIPSVIFDEIDTGISGRIAQSVGEKMYNVSLCHQVFCVTHLPQIASISDVHYLVSKEVIGEKTFTKVKRLSKEEKELEVAKMIGTSEVTKITLEHAKELIKMSDAKKRIKN